MGRKLKILFLAGFLFGQCLQAQTGSPFRQFSAMALENKVRLSWLLEEGSQCFDMKLSRSTDSLHFSTFYTWPGHCGGGVLFHYEDSFPAPGLKNFYRLESQAGDRSEIVAVDYRFGGDKSLLVFPGVDKETLHFVFANPDRQSASAEIYNLQGKLLTQVPIQGENHLSLNLQSFESGVYLVIIRREKGEVWLGRFYK